MKFDRCDRFFHALSESYQVDEAQDLHWVLINLVFKRGLVAVTLEQNVFYCTDNLSLKLCKPFLKLNANGTYCFERTNLKEST